MLLDELEIRLAEQQTDTGGHPGNLLDDIGGTHGSGNDPIEAVLNGFRPFGHNDEIVQLASGFPQKDRLALVRFDQGDAPGWVQDRDGDTGEAGPGADIGDGAAAAGRRGSDC